MGARMFFREDSPRDKSISNEQWDKRYAVAFPDSKKEDSKSSDVPPMSYQAYLEKFRRENPTKILMRSSQ